MANQSRPAHDPDGLLDGIAGKQVELLVQPADGSAAVKQTIVPITLKEARISPTSAGWTSAKTMTEKLSGGRLGYIYHSRDGQRVNYKRAFERSHRRLP